MILLKKGPTLNSFSPAAEGNHIRSLYEEGMLGYSGLSWGLGGEVGPSCQKIPDGYPLLGTF